LGGNRPYSGGLGNDRSACQSCHSIASALNGTNDIEIPVFANETRRQALLIAEFDLGKGASGAAVQNLMLTLGRWSAARSERSSLWNPDLAQAFVHALDPREIDRMVAEGRGSESRDGEARIEYETRARRFAGVFETAKVRERSGKEEMRHW
jgi:hypothetical protein